MSLWATPFTSSTTVTLLLPLQMTRTWAGMEGQTCYVPVYKYLM